MSAGRPFYERPRFLALAAVVALVAGLVAIIGPPKPWQVISGVVSPGLPASNTAIVLDTSAGMRRPFGASGTRLDAAVNAVAGFAVPFKNEGLALRVFGGPCHEAGERLVDFGEDHGDEVSSAAAGERPDGESNLANAVIAAIDEFADDDRFPDDESPKRVVVFTGSADSCRGRSAAGEIRSELEHSGVNAVFKLVGVRVSRQDRRQLLGFKTVLGNSVDVAFADTMEQLLAVGKWSLSGLGADNCADGVDNDGDGLVDGDDPGCVEGGDEQPVDGAIGGGECADGVDNDGDGQIDAAEDPGCAEDGTEDDAPAGGECADGVDNDGDGLIDGAEDPGCAEDGTEQDADPPEGDCADGLDNDGDGLLDATDPSCADGTEEPADGP